MKVVENRDREQCLIAAAQRDPKHFEELYENNFDRVYAYIARRVETRHDAEDLTAEVFHEALRKLRNFEWRGLPFAAWLLGIAAHLLADRWRQVGKRTTVSIEDCHPPRDDIYDPHSATLQQMSDANLADCATLGQLVDQLPPDQRQVIVRRFVEQKSLREIADEMCRSEGAIKQLQFRALKNLRMRMVSCHVESVPSTR